MRIRQLQSCAFELPYVTPFTTAHGVQSRREGLLVRLISEEGLIGLGEAAPVTAFGGGTLADVQRLLAQISPRVTGLSVDAVAAYLPNIDLHQPGGAALSCAFDTALLDLRAKGQGIRLAEQLQQDHAAPSQPIRLKLPVNATIGTADTAAACQAARRVLAQGFRAIKLKVGVTRSLPEEIERITAVQQAIGGQATLRIDANGAWTVDEAIWVLQRLTAIEYAEQPVADLRDMARVRAACAVPIAADENCGTLDEAQRVIATEAADLLIIKPMMAGGLHQAAQIADLARQTGLQAVVTTTIDSGVGCAAALQLAATLTAPLPACGLATAALLQSDLLRQSLTLAAGQLVLPSGSGLGVDLDAQLLQRYGHGWV